MRPITASQLQRTAACPASASLPAVFEEAGDAANLGTAIHLYLQRVIDGGCKAALSATPEEHRALCAAIDVEWLDSSVMNADAEQAYVYNVFDGSSKKLGRLDRGYPSPKRGDVFCTIDLIRHGGVPRVTDFKTGRHRVASCRDNWQMRLAALAMGGDAVDMQIAYLQEDGSWQFDDAHADAMDLDAWRLELRAIYERAELAAQSVQAGRSPDVYPTEDGCRWCPCFRSCPAKHEQIVALVRATGVETSIGALDAPAAGAVWSKLVEYERLIETMKAALAERAAREPLPLPSGKVLRMVESSREYVDGVIAQRILTEQFGPEIAAQICKPSATKTAFKALGKRANAALEAVRTAGGIEVKTSMSAKEVKE